MTPRQPWVSLALASAFVVVLVALVYVEPEKLKNYPSTPINVAMVGNSMQYFNDCPRLMEALSSSNLRQNSCLHGGATLTSILLSGNGMLYKWNSPNALRSDGTYDLGACSVPQLLFGYDPNLADLMALDYENDDDYIPVETNPCSTTLYRYHPHHGMIGAAWDYVVLNDNTRHPGVRNRREESIQTLNDTYVEWFLATGATPVFLDTHAYDSEMRERLFGSVADMTSRTYYGYQLYVDLVAPQLPESQAPRIAPVGVAFLVVHDERPDLWEKMFDVDKVHASPTGTYLQSCVLHATLFGFLPYRSVALNAYSIANVLWERARFMAFKDFPVQPLPTLEDCRYLYNVAERVAMKGYRPRSFVNYYDMKYLPWDL